jgi:hypothetical protein
VPARIPAMPSQETHAAPSGAGPSRRTLIVSLAWGIGVSLLIGLAIAIALWAIDRGGLRIKLIYSWAISLCCWVTVDGLRRVYAYVLLRRARVQGLPLELGGPGWPVVLGLVVLTVLIGPSAGLAIGDAITGIQSTPLFNIGAGSSRTTLTMTVLGTSIGLAVWSVQARLARERLAAEQARKAALEQQLLLLQTQLEPHMLFNTLANLRVLIASDSERAQAMLDRLIAFLRATLAASRSGRHALADEFARLADYLENAIRHGLEPKVAGGEVRVVAERIDHAGAPPQLRLTVADTGVGLAADSTADEAPGNAGSRHFGTRQVRERLAALHGAAARFELLPAPAGSGTHAVVTLPLDLEPRPAQP